MKFNPYPASRHTYGGPSQKPALSLYLELLSSFVFSSQKAAFKFFEVGIIPLVCTASIPMEISQSQSAVT